MLLRKVMSTPDRTAPVVLILGFFDGIHLGHRRVINTAVNFAQENEAKTLLITFKDSPAEYFSKNVEYIFSRSYSYNLIKSLGVNEIVECNFPELAQITATDYLKNNLVQKYSPIAIFTGFNHTFGVNRSGTPEFLEQNQNNYNYKYFCSEACLSKNEIVSSTLIKKYLREGNVVRAKELLGSPFALESNVVKGEQLGRKIGFPTANLPYPEKIVKIPYGVYLVKVLGKKAVLNWGIKPTVNGRKEGLEVHIPNFNEDLYGKNLKLEFIKKLRDEKKFGNIEELKAQIAKDVEECLK